MKNRDDMIALAKQGKVEARLSGPGGRMIKDFTQVEICAVYDMRSGRTIGDGRLEHQIINDGKLPYTEAALSRGRFNVKSEIPRIEFANGATIEFRKIA